MVVVVGMDLDSELLVIVITGTDVRDLAPFSCVSTFGTGSSVVIESAAPEQMGSLSAAGCCEVWCESGNNRSCTSPTLLWTTLRRAAALCLHDVLKI